MCWAFVQGRGLAYFLTAHYTPGRVRTHGGLANTVNQISQFATNNRSTINCKFAINSRIEAVFLWGVLNWSLCCIFSELMISMVRFFRQLCKLRYESYSIRSVLRDSYVLAAKNILLQFGIEQPPAHAGQFFFFSFGNSIWPPWHWLRGTGRTGVRKGYHVSEVSL